MSKNRQEIIARALTRSHGCHNIASYYIILYSLYQWGRQADGHQLRASETSATQADSITPNSADYINSLAATGALRFFLKMRHLGSYI